MKNNNINTG